jgi:phage shock protein PspC (stress-responsive transcriptional regulator)|tara:strand:- start:51 stop:200 length:150 start_codon:yes stop_codon:yes gene_type:complete
MNYIALIFALICIIAKAALFGISAYILYLIFIKKDKETINTVKDLKRLV